MRGVMTACTCRAGCEHRISRRLHAETNAGTSGAKVSLASKLTVRHTHTHTHKQRRQLPLEHVPDTGTPSEPRCTHDLCILLALVTSQQLPLCCNTFGPHTWRRC